MTESEFIKKAKEYGYSDDQIKDILDLRQKEKTKFGQIVTPFDVLDKLLVEQPKY